MSDATDLNFMAHPDMDRLAGLMFELASQLHVERQRRMALETLMVTGKKVTPKALQALAGDEQFLGQARAELDRSLRRLMRVITEHGDARGPLRAEHLE